jgi:hypothetical protein
MIVPLNEYDLLKCLLIVHSNEEAIVCGGLRLAYQPMGSWKRARLAAADHRRH